LLKKLVICFQRIIMKTTTKKEGHTSQSKGRQTAMAELFEKKINNEIVQVNHVVYSNDYINFQAVINKEKKVNINCDKQGRWVDDDTNEETEFTKMIGKMIEKHFESKKQ